MLYELIYRSEATNDTLEKDIQDILDAARSFNEANNISGCLLYSNNQFLQLIEGDFALLMELYERIKKDDRHQNLVLLHMREIESRTYPKWTMAFQSIDQVEIKDKAGVTEFKGFGPEQENSLSKQLFQAVSHSMAN